MQSDQTRRKFLTGSATASALALAGCTGSEEGPEPGPEDEDDEDVSDVDESEQETDEADRAGPGYEIWALDQGRDNVHIYVPGGGTGEFERDDEIDLNALEGLPSEGVTPHMIDFSSDYAYAAIACTAGGKTLIVRTEDRELVEAIETGPGSHMASFDPSDEYVHVDVIGEDKIVRVDADLEAEAFAVVDEIALHEDEVVADAGIDSGAPICHQYDKSGRSLHTVGPGYGDGALVVVDHDPFEVVEAYPHEVLPTNCGTMPHPTEDKFYLTAGLPSNPEADEEGVGDYYVYDAETDEVLTEDGVSTGGVDAHGFWFTPDGEELWVLNRETNDGVILDPETDEIIEEIDAYGEHQSDDPEARDAPDIMWTSPDGEYMFVSLRGPVPRSGDPHAATGVTPGFSVIDVGSREIVDVVEPDPIDEYDDETVEFARAVEAGEKLPDEDESVPRIPDFHGVGVRPIADYDTEIPNSPPF